MPLPTIKQLRYLVALDEHRHFGKAAKICHISQSGFSIAIKELEDLLGIQLIDRTNKSCTITPLGKQIVDRARICLRDIESLVDIPKHFQSPMTGKITLGVIPTIAPYLLPDLLVKLPANFPALKLYLKEQFTQLLYDELQAGYIDLMLVALPYEFKHVEIMPLFRDRFLLAHHPHTRWLDDDHDILKQLKEESVLLLEDGHCLRAHTLTACKLQHSSKVSQFSGSSLHTLLYMVCNDLGVTFIPAMAEKAARALEPMVRLQELTEENYREIGLVWRKNSSHFEEFSRFGEFIRHCHAESIRNY
jgi:LysR family transcriptional regulator, hydrogen peroxide-inducible genes activator